MCYRPHCHKRKGTSWQRAQLKIATVLQRKSGCAKPITAGRLESRQSQALFDPFGQQVRLARLKAAAETRDGSGCAKPTPDAHTEAATLLAPSDPSSKAARPARLKAATARADAKGCATRTPGAHTEALRPTAASGHIAKANQMPRPRRTVIPRCAAPSCDRDARANGLCPAHNMRRQRGRTTSQPIRTYIRKTKQ